MVDHSDYWNITDTVYNTIKEYHKETLPPFHKLFPFHIARKLITGTFVIDLQINGDFLTNAELAAQKWDEKDQDFNVDVIHELGQETLRQIWKPLRMIRTALGIKYGVDRVDVIPVGYYGPQCQMILRIRIFDHDV